MFLGFVGIGKVARGFDHNLGSDRLPGKLARVSLLKNFKDLVADGDAVRAGGDLVWQIAQDGIVFQQVSQGFGVGKVVDRHEFDVAVIERSSKHVSPDASESVDAYFYRHFSSGSLLTTVMETAKLLSGMKMLTGN
jgi:hypothetical protein